MSRDASPRPSGRAHYAPVSPRREVADIRRAAVHHLATARRRLPYVAVLDRVGSDDAMADMSYACHGTGGVGSTAGMPGGGAAAGTVSGGSGSGGSAGQHPDLSVLLRRGRSVWVDVYCRRVAAVICGQMEYHRKYKVRIKVSPEARELGGSKAVVEVQNMLFRLGREFVPVQQFAQRVARGTPLAAAVAGAVGAPSSSAAPMDALQLGRQIHTAVSAYSVALSRTIAVQLLADSPGLVLSEAMDGGTAVVMDNSRADADADADISNLTVLPPPPILAHGSGVLQGGSQVSPVPVPRPNFHLLSLLRLVAQGSMMHSLAALGLSSMSLPRGCSAAPPLSALQVSLASAAASSAAVLQGASDGSEVDHGAVAPAVATVAGSGLPAPAAVLGTLVTPAAAGMWVRGAFIRRLCLPLVLGDSRPLDQSVAGTLLHECVGQLLRCGTGLAGARSPRVDVTSAERDASRCSDARQAPCVELAAFLLDVLLEAVHTAPQQGAQAPAPWWLPLRQHLFSDDMLRLLRRTMSAQSLSMPALLLVLQLLARLLRQPQLFTSAPDLAFLPDLGSVFAQHVSEQRSAMARGERVAHSSFVQAVAEVLVAGHRAARWFLTARPSGRASSAPERKVDNADEADRKTPDREVGGCGSGSGSGSRTASRSGTGRGSAPESKGGSDGMADVAAPRTPAHSLALFAEECVQLLLTVEEFSAQYRQHGLATSAALTLLDGGDVDEEAGGDSDDDDDDDSNPWTDALDAELVLAVCAAVAGKTASMGGAMNVDPEVLMHPTMLPAKLAPISALRRLSAPAIVERIRMLQRFNALVADVLPLLSPAPPLTLAMVAQHVVGVGRRHGRGSEGASGGAAVRAVKHLLFPDFKSQVTRQVLGATQHVPARQQQEDPDSLEFLLGEPQGVGEGAVRHIVVNRWNAAAANDIVDRTNSAAAAAAAAAAAPGAGSSGDGDGGGNTDGAATAADVQALSKYTVFVQLFDQLYYTIAPTRLRQSRRPWRVDFEGEGGQDAGGLFSESLTLSVEDLMLPRLHLFVPTPNGVKGTGGLRDRLVPNPTATTPTDLRMFEFLGRLMGVGVRLNFPLPLRLPPLVWKAFVMDTATVKDLADVDFDFARHLSVVDAAVQAGDAAKLQSLLQFTTFTAPSADGVRRLELLPGGAATRVTAAKAGEYVALALRSRLVEFREAVTAMREGFTSVVPLGVARLLSWHELETLVCGSPGLDVAMLRRHTRYDGFSASHPVVAMFWRVLEAMAPEQQASVLRFVWARDRLPTSDAGWGRPFTVARMARDDPDASLPQSHTCSFQIDLPEYSCDDAMRTALERAAEFSGDYDLDGGSAGFRPDVELMG